MCSFQVALIDLDARELFCISEELKPSILARLARMGVDIVISGPPAPFPYPGHAVPADLAEKLNQKLTWDTLDWELTSDIQEKIISGGGDLRALLRAELEANMRGETYKWPWEFSRYPTGEDPLVGLEARGYRESFDMDVEDFRPVTPADRALLERLAERVSDLNTSFRDDDYSTELIVELDATTQLLATVYGGSHEFSLGYTWTLTDGSVSSGDDSSVPLHHLDEAELELRKLLRDIPDMKADEEAYEADVPPEVEDRLNELAELLTDLKPVITSTRDGPVLELHYDDEADVRVWYYPEVGFDIALFVTLANGTAVDRPKPKTFSPAEAESYVRKIFNKVPKRKRKMLEKYGSWN